MPGGSPVGAPIGFRPACPMAFRRRSCRHIRANRLRGIAGQRVAPAQNVIEKRIRSRRDRRCERSCGRDCAAAAAESPRRKPHRCRDRRRTRPHWQSRSDPADPPPRRSPTGCRSRPPAAARSRSAAAWLSASTSGLRAGSPRSPKAQDEITISADLSISGISRCKKARAPASSGVTMRMSGRCNSPAIPGTPIRRGTTARDGRNRPARRAARLIAPIGDFEQMLGGNKMLGNQYGRIDQGQGRGFMPACSMRDCAARRSRRSRDLGDDRRRRRIRRYVKRNTPAAPRWSARRRHDR